MTEIEKAIAAIEEVLKVPADILFQGEPFHYIIDKAAHTALVVLKERVERENGCEKCDTDNAASLTSDVYMAGDIGDKYISSSSGSECAGIYYCPMCGRTLEVKQDG